MNLAHYLFNLLPSLLFQDALLIVDAQNVLMDALKLLDEVLLLLLRLFLLVLDHLEGRYAHLLFEVVYFCKLSNQLFVVGVALLVGS